LTGLRLFPGLASIRNIEGRLALDACLPLAFGFALAKAQGKRKPKGKTSIKMKKAENCSKATLLLIEGGWTWNTAFLEPPLGDLRVQKKVDVSLRHLP